MNACAYSARSTRLSGADFGARLDAVRAAGPLVQCVTNSVVTNFTANVLLASGAAPAMVDIPRESGPFAAVASGVLINLGTPAPSQAHAMGEAVASAVQAGTPWVLDPVAIGALPVRTELAHELVALRPTIVRGNASEILALAGSGEGGRGVDSSDSPEAALRAAGQIAEWTGGAVAVSGEVDVIVGADGAVVRLANGTPLLTKVTGGGCALGAVMAAFASIEPDPLAAAASATAFYTVAAQVAAEASEGPGSFQVSFLDALAAVAREDIERRTVVR
ncbi:MAG: hydroxyethylthiazole kinase [Actinomycetaceae bacterium]|nr:hydroxyethylthiazole kinase [Actinomycetaceae bacterium]